MLRAVVPDAVPVPHGTHIPKLSRAPAGHGKQCAEESAPDADVDHPAEHGVHPSVPGASAYVPLGHAAHATLPDTAPTAQSPVSTTCTTGACPWGHT